MANDNGSQKYFTDACNETYELWDNDELEACIENARELLRQPGIPRYHRMKTLVLLGATLGDWREANACREHAECNWHIVRRWHPAGENSKNDTAMQELRISIDELRQALADEEPVEDDSDAAFEEKIAIHDEAVEVENGVAIAEHGDREETLAADARALDTTGSPQTQQPQALL
jgi:hypothetical protein